MPSNYIISGKVEQEIATDDSIGIRLLDENHRNSEGQFVQHLATELHNGDHVLPIKEFALTGSQKQAFVRLKIAKCLCQEAGSPLAHLSPIELSKGKTVSFYWQ